MSFFTANTPRSCKYGSAFGYPTDHTRRPGNPTNSPGSATFGREKFQITQNTNQWTDPPNGLRGANNGQGYGYGSPKTHCRPDSFNSPQRAPFGSAQLYVDPNSPHQTDKSVRSSQFSQRIGTQGQQRIERKGRNAHPPGPPGINQPGMMPHQFDRFLQNPPRRRRPPGMRRHGPGMKPVEFDGILDGVFGAVLNEPQLSGFKAVQHASDRELPTRRLNYSAPSGQLLHSDSHFAVPNDGKRTTPQPTSRVLPADVGNLRLANPSTLVTRRLPSPPSLRDCNPIKPPGASSFSSASERHGHPSWKLPPHPVMPVRLHKFSSSVLSFKKGTDKICDRCNKLSELGGYDCEILDTQQQGIYRCESWRCVKCVESEAGRAMVCEGSVGHLVNWNRQ